MRTDKAAEVDDMLKKGFARKGPVLMEFMIKKTENVYPMVPAGKSIDDILTGEQSNG